MMKSYLSLAWKELKAQRVTSVLILFAVILSAITTTVMGRSVGILQTMRVRQAAGLNGDRYVTFHQLTQEQNRMLYEDMRLRDVGSYITVGYRELEDSSLKIFLREYYGDALSAYPGCGTIKEGRLPGCAGEIALSGDALRYLGAEGRLGERISLPLQAGLLLDDGPHYEYAAEFILTGILENNYLGYATGIIDGIVGEGTAESLLPERYLRYSTDFKVEDKDRLQEIVEDLAGRLEISTRQVQYNWVLLDALGVDYPDKEGNVRDVGFPFMMIACVMVGALVLLAAGLVVYNILKVAVVKRIREYGTLRALGGSKGQLYALVTVQAMILAIAGLPLGMLLGVCLTRGILTAAAGLFNPGLFMADTTQELNRMIAESGSGGMMPLVASAFVTLVFAAVAAYPSAAYASRVSPTVAMGGQAVKVKRSNRKMKRIRNFEAFYAWLNLSRHRGRTIITVLSIVMSITVFVTLQGFGNLLDTSQAIQALHLGDYCITSEKVGITPKALSLLEGQEAVTSIATTKLAVYMQETDGSMPLKLDFQLHPGETFQIAAVDEERIMDYRLENELSEEDKEAIRNGEACLVVNPIPISFDGQEAERTQLEKGSTVTVNGRKLRIAGITSSPVCINNAGFTNGVQMIGTDELYDALVGDDKYHEVFLSLQEDYDAKAFEDWLDKWCEDSPGAHWLSYRQADAQSAESFEQIRLLCWGLIFFMGLIGILNIVNTVYTNIHTRVNEIGMQRAIGMDKGSLYRTFLWEGAYYGIVASAVGAVSGYICTVFVDAAANDGLRLCAVPTAANLEAAIVSVAACLIATAIPLRAMGKKSIVEAVCAVE